MNIKNFFYVAFLALTLHTPHILAMYAYDDNGKQFVTLCEQNPLQTDACISMLQKLGISDEAELVIGLNYALEKKDSALKKAILKEIKKIHDTRALWDYFSPAPDITNHLILRALENNLTAVLSMILQQNKPLHTQNMLKKQLNFIIITVYNT